MIHYAGFDIEALEWMPVREIDEWWRFYVELKEAEAKLLEEKQQQNGNR